MKSSNPVKLAHCTGNNEWYTPPNIIKLVKVVMGGIDLDPASSSVANKTVNAKEYYTVDIDGLKQTWHGRVFLNPPYAKGLVEAFASKLCISFRNRDVDQACLLVNNSTETTWFQECLHLSSAVCLCEGRLHFIRSDGTRSDSALQGQSVLYFGLRFVDFYWAFSTIGTVLLSMSAAKKLGDGIT